MRLLLGSLVVTAAVACGPKVDTRTPFDEDDPRAGTVPIDAGVIDAPTVDAAPLGVRATEVTRAGLVAVLDAGPGELLRSLEVSAVRDGDKFQGWRLVRLLPSGKRFAALDVVPGDLIVGVNGHALESPPDLAALWQELRTAATIEAVIERSGTTFTVRADVTP